MMSFRFFARRRLIPMLALFLLVLWLKLVHKAQLQQQRPRLPREIQRDSDYMRGSLTGVVRIDFDAMEEAEKKKRVVASGVLAGKTTALNGAWNTTAWGGPLASNENLTVPMYKISNGRKLYVPFWQRRLQQFGTLGHFHGNKSVEDKNGSVIHYNLVELLQCRIYEEDKAKWTIRELKQWMHYMFLSGVEHILLCDHYKFDHERLDIPLKRYIDAGLVTYFPWSNIRHPMTAQVQCYQHMIDNYKELSTWQIAIDMDEYPFSNRDTKEGFLSRYVQNVTDMYGFRLTEVSLSNFLMLGQGDRKRKLVIDRINRMTPNKANILDKPLYRPERVRANIHHNNLLFGIRITAEPDALRMLHYWGARHQNWGPDTPETLAETIEMNAMRNTWPEQVKNSLLTFGEFDAFSNETGP